VIWQVLTKRAERMYDFFSRSAFLINAPLQNLWLGVTAENQEMADLRIPVLLRIPARVRFVSIEPMIGPVDLASPGYLRMDGCHTLADGQSFPDICLACGGSGSPRVDWVIVGGESGPGWREIRYEWLIDIQRQCSEARVAFFFKQWAGLRVRPDGAILHGKHWREFPQAH